VLCEHSTLVLVNIYHNTKYKVDDYICTSCLERVFDQHEVTPLLIARRPSKIPRPIVVFRRTNVEVAAVAQTEC
jgi:hypothetical protein